jgi:hypothetical protein
VPLLARDDGERPAALRFEKRNISLVAVEKSARSLSAVTDAAVATPLTSDAERERGTRVPVMRRLLSTAGFSSSPAPRRRYAGGDEPKPSYEYAGPRLTIREIRLKKRRSQAADWMSQLRKSSSTVSQPSLMIKCEGWLAVAPKGRRRTTAHATHRARCGDREASPQR